MTTGVRSTTPFFDVALYDCGRVFLSGDASRRIALGGRLTETFITVLPASRRPFKYKIQKSLVALKQSAKLSSSRQFYLCYDEGHAHDGHGRQLLLAAAACVSVDGGRETRRQGPCCVGHGMCSLCGKKVMQASAKAMPKVELSAQRCLQRPTAEQTDGGGLRTTLQT